MTKVNKKRTYEVIAESYPIDWAKIKQTKIKRERSIYHCWSCNKDIKHKLDVEDFYFWCDEECFSKDEAFKKPIE